MAERDQATRSQGEAEEAFRREGADAGFKKFVALAAVDFSDREPDAALMAPTSERAPKRLFAVCYANRANLLDDPTDAT